jgi:acyl-CoA thioester hydrolase
MSGFHYAEIEKMGYLLMVTGVEVRYRRPARYGDIVKVVCWGEKLGSRGLRFAYEVKKGDDILATGASDHVWIESKTGKPCTIPAPLREPFRRLAGL